MKHLLAILTLSVPMIAHADLVGDPMVLDGDTMSFGEKKVDLFGVHAPTITQTCGESGSVWSCGWEAVLHLEELVRAGDVVCVEVSDTDSPTPLARCTVDGVDLAGQMIDAGLAVRDETLGEGLCRARTGGRYRKTGHLGRSLHRPRDVGRKQRVCLQRPQEGSGRDRRPAQSRASRRIAQKTGELFSPVVRHVQ